MNHLGGGLTKKQYKIKSSDGTEISVWRIADRNNTSPSSPAIVHAHGGAFILRNTNMESVDMNKFSIKQLGQEWLPQSGIVLLYVRYRLATESTFPGPVDDVYSTFKWATGKETAIELGINRYKVGLMGVSAGGYLALSSAFKARDESLNPPVFGLVLIYPMLDPDISKKEPTKGTELLKKGWDTLLAGSESLPDEQKQYAKPLLVDCTGLPRTYVDVGTEDHFFKEDCKLMDNLKGANVDLVCEKWEGMPHGFELGYDSLDPQLREAQVKEARRSRQAFLKNLFEL